MRLRASVSSTFLVLESETARKDEDVLADGKRVLTEMTAIMLGARVLRCQESGK
jgi:hypothetical protein